jgi:hypothetical protein
LLNKISKISQGALDEIPELLRFWTAKSSFVEECMRSDRPQYDWIDVETPAFEPKKIRPPINAAQPADKASQLKESEEPLGPIPRPYETPL